MEYNELPISTSASSQKANQQAARSVFGPDSQSAFESLWKGLSVTDSDVTTSDVAKKEIMHFNTQPPLLDQEKTNDEAGAELKMLRKFRTTNWACL